MGGKGKLQKFAEVHAFGNVLEPFYPEIIAGFKLKGNWNKDYFRNNNPIILELACGKADYAVTLAERNPETNYIGIDIKGARIWRGAKTAKEKNLINIGFLRIQIDLIEFCFARDEVSEIWITFPDPFPNKPKEQKRLTSPNFLNKFVNILKPGGIIHLKTDNAGLFDYTLDIIKEHNHSLHFVSRDVYYTDVPHEVKSIQTFYEKIFLEQSLPIHYLKFSLK